MVAYSTCGGSKLYWTTTVVFVNRWAPSLLERPTWTAQWKQQRRKEPATSLLIWMARPSPRGIQRLQRNSLWTARSRKEWVVAAFLQTGRPQQPEIMQAVGPGSLLAVTAASCWASVHMDLLCYAAARVVGLSVCGLVFVIRRWVPSPVFEMIWFTSGLCMGFWSVLVVTCPMEQPYPYGVWCRFVVYNGWRVVPFCCVYNGYYNIYVSYK